MPPTPASPSPSAESKKVRSPLYRRPGVFVLAAIPLLTVPYLLKEDEDEKDKAPALTLLSNRDLIRSYIVYSLCSFPSLIDVSPRLIDWAWNSYIPGVRLLAELAIQYTFFEQFVGAETLEQSRPVVEKLARDNIGTLFNYSVEASEASQSQTAPADSTSPLHEGLVQEITRSVEHAAKMNEAEGLGTAVALKLSGLLKDPAVLLRVSSAIVKKEHFTDSGHLALTRVDLWDYLARTMSISDADAVSHLLQALEKAGEIARPAGVKLIIDAEQSWLQPAIDALFLQVARKCNRVEEAKQDKGRWTSALSSKKTTPVNPAESQPPVFYTTLQCSLRRSADLLEALLDDGRQRGWSVGVKVVRGAYVDQEHKAAELAKTLTPAWSSKEETDKCFNMCAQLLLDDIAGDLSNNRPGAAGAMFASHNRDSVTALLKLLQERGLAKPFDAAKDAVAPFAETAVVPASAPDVPVVATAVAPSSDEVPTLMMDYAAARRICFGQLYGMADDITNRLSKELLTPSRTAPAVYKYLPYGPLDRVLPYLVRRAKENKAIMTSNAGGGGAAAEKKRLKAEMRKRVKDWWRGSAAYSTEQQATA